MINKKNILNRMMCLSLLASLGFAALLCGAASPALAQLMGDAQSFAVLGGSSVTVGGGGATINGDLGVAPGTSITGGPTVTPPFSNLGNTQPAIDARAAWVPLNNSLLSGTCSPLTSDQLNGQTLGPGCWSGGALDLASGGTLNLTIDGIYIFRAASSLTTGTGSNVNLNGVVNPCNVFWQVTSLATIDGTIPGTVVADAGVHLGTGAVLTGRALAGVGGDVTMAGGNAVGGCSFTGPGLATPTLTRPGPLPSGTVGTPMIDTKTLGNAAIPTGTITFTLYGPNDFTCSSAIFTSTPVTVNGNGSYSSPSFTPTAVGTYFWIASYSGDGNNAAATTICGDTTESVVVTAAATAVPTLNEWGVIIFMLLAGLGSVYYMRKQKRV